MKFMPNLSLTHLIKTKLDSIDNTARQIILIGISYGLKYLHNRYIIHRDIKPDNILIDENYYPYIADFGLSKMFNVNYSDYQSKFPGTLIYTAPEILIKDAYNTKIDVYSFGILMYQIVTNNLKPYKIGNEAGFIAKVINKEKPLRPKFNIEIKESIKNLIEKCWSGDPNERPSFNEIFDNLTCFINKNNDDYCLDNVDKEKVKQYVEMITRQNPLERHLNEVLEDLIKIKEQKEILQSENEKLKSENKKLIQINKQIENNQNDEYNIVIDQPISNIQINSENDLIVNNITVEIFNCMPLISQKLTISKLISQYNNNHFYEKIDKLLSFLENFNELSQFKCIEIFPYESYTMMNKIKEENQIKLVHEAVQILFLKKELDSENLIEILSNFNECIIEIEYKSKYFDGIYNIVCRNIKKIIKTIKISIFITETDQKFYDDQNINYIRMDPSIRTIKSNDYKGSFQKCSNLVQIIISSSLNIIGSFSFSECISLTHIEIPSSVFYIESNAFSNCTKLKHIIIPSSVYHYGDNAFNGCTSLEQITIPSLITNQDVSIGEGIFQGCKSLHTIKILANIKKIEKIHLMDAKL